MVAAVESVAVAAAWEMVVAMVAVAWETAIVVVAAMQAARESQGSHAVTAAWRAAASGLLTPQSTTYRHRGGLATVTLTLLQVAPLTSC